MHEDVIRRLADLGAAPEDVERAEREGWLPLLALDRLLVPGTARFDINALADASGFDPEFTRHLWRAVGFPDVPADLALFTDRDVEAARLLHAHATVRGIDDRVLLQQVRVISSSLARVAAVEADAFAAFVESLRESGASDEDIALSVFSDTRFANIAVLIDYVHRLQLRAAVWRRLAFDTSPDLTIGVGFADISGYTRLTGGLDPAELSDLLSRWESVAYDTTAAHGSRIVKTIGDEVMFVGLPGETVLSAIALRDAARLDGLPPLRIGAASGLVIRRDGDYYGPVVNLASRLTDIADPGEVLVPADLVAELDQAPLPGIRFDPLGARPLRGIGDVEVFSVATAG
jgi:adenylate cyclase